MSVQWTSFKAQYSRSYATVAEDAARFAIFSSNMAEAKALTNAALAAGLDTKVRRAHDVCFDQQQLTSLPPRCLPHCAHSLPFQFGATKFSDLTPAEFAATHLNYLAGSVVPTSTLDVVVTGNVTARDWRGNLTTPVKDQGDCGSCWAFSATEQMESMWLKAEPSKAVPLSAQQITSCDKADLGCNGGDTKSAYASVMKEGGMMTEKAYPYTSGKKGKSGKCEFEKAKVVMTIKSHANVGKKNEGTMTTYVGNIAPLSICVDASKWQNYKKGIMTCVIGGRVVM